VQGNSVAGRSVSTRRSFNLATRAQSCSAARPASLAGQTSARKAKALKLQRPLLSEVLMVIATAARQDAAESDPPVALSEPRATR